MIEEESHCTQKSASLNDRLNLTELTAVCTTAGQWLHLTH